MPPTKLTDAQRRAVVLAALRGESATRLAAEYGIDRARVYQLAAYARREAREEAAYWREVERLTG